MNNIKDHPLPPDDFNKQLLPTSEYSQSWYRLNPASYDQRSVAAQLSTKLRPTDSAIYFDRSGRGRFDSPQASYGILYVAQNERGAFIETMGRTLGIRTVSGTALQQRNLFVIECDRPLVIVDVWGVNLTKLGVDARISSGNYEVSRAWAKAIYEHPQKVDGICYRSRHDDTEICCGVFDRTAPILKEVNLGNLIEHNSKLLASILKYYDYSLI